jgi:beta-glucosidase
MTLVVVLVLLAAPSALGATAAQRRAAAVLARMTTTEKLALVSSGSVGDARLGIPPLRFIDGPNGIGEGTPGVTAFPDAEAIGASWSPSLALAFGRALGGEAAGKGDSLLAAPTINIVRTPKWGREPETLGEDPFLTASLAAPEIEGIQSQHVISQVKHFVAYNQELDRFGYPLAGPADSVQISQRALEEIYFPGFRAAVAQGHAASVMCSYNRINTLYACQDPATLGRLRAWGLTGFVGPDAVLAVRDQLAAELAGVDNFQLAGSESVLAAGLADGQLPAARLDQMAERVLTAMFAVGLFEHPPNLHPRASVSTGAHLRLATRIAEQATVLLRNRDGVLPLSAQVGSIAVIGHDAGPGTQIEEGGSPAVNHGPVITPLQGIRSHAGRRVRVTYAPGTDGVVPLPVVPAAVLRPSSGSGEGLSASYYTATDLSGAPALTRVDQRIDFASVGAPLQPIPGTPGARSARWTGTLIPPSNGLYRFSLTIAGAAQLYINGRELVHGDSEFANAALALPGALPADPGAPTISFQGEAQLTRGRPVSIRVQYSTAASIGGARLQLGWQPPDPSMLARAVQAARRARVAIVFANDVSAEGMDRTSLELPGDQDRLIEAVAAVNDRTIVVLHTAGPVLMPWLSKVSSVIEAWYPGQQSGRAMAATLFGDADPAGRLPVTFPASASQGPATRPSEYPGINGRVDYSEGIFVGYRYYQHFGQRPLFPFGYGQSYTRFSFRRMRIRRVGNGRFAVSVQVLNTGLRAGYAVVELYVGDPRSTGEPPNQLKGFAKLQLARGAMRTVTIKLDRQDFETWSTSHDGWTLTPGQYSIRVGSSSSALPLSQTVAVG